jgi:transcriptional regulator with XRE-family HTH domain
MEHEEILMDAVRDLRTELGLSQAAFATRLNVSPSTIYRWEAASPPRGAVLALLAELAQEVARPDLQGAFNVRLGCDLSPAADPSDQPGDRHCHDLLDIILHEGGEEDRLGIQKSLEWAAYSVRRGRQVRPKPR